MMTYHLWIIPLVAVALAQLAAVATSVYLHRGLAHRALVLHPVTDVCFRTILWLTRGQNRREWVAVHRKHHTFTDQEGDPHSPRLSVDRRGPGRRGDPPPRGSSQNRPRPYRHAGR